MHPNDLSPNEERLVLALALMCGQYLTVGRRSGQEALDHMCMSAGEEAVELLIDYGVLQSTPRGGTWTAAGLALLENRR